MQISRFLILGMCAVATFSAATGCGQSTQSTHLDTPSEIEIRDEVYTELGHIKLVLPEGFTINSDAKMDENSLAANADDGATISISNMEKDNIDDYSKESIEESYSKLISGFKEVTDFQRTTIDGYDAIDVTYVFEVADLSFTQNQVLIFGEDFSVSIIFGSTSENYDGAFNSCKRTIKII